MVFLFILGPSGSGKSHLEQLIIKSHISELYHKVVSFTSRSIRLEDGEVDGVDYHFLTENEFFERIPGLLEHVRFHGNHYGMDKSLTNEDKINITVVEPTGLKQLVDNCIKNNHDYDIIHMDIHDNIRYENLKLRDGNAKRLHDGIRGNYKALCDTNEAYLPTITIIKMLDDTLLVNLVNTLRLSK